VGLRTRSPSGSPSPPPTAATWSPAARRGYLLPIDLVRTPAYVDVDGTRRLDAEAEREGVGHFLHVSIVGLQQVRLPYARVKLAAEKLVRASNVPWSIVAATGFHWLWHRMLTKHLEPCLLPINSQSSSINVQDAIRSSSSHSRRMNQPTDHPTTRCGYTPLTLAVGRGFGSTGPRSSTQ